MIMCSCTSPPSDLDKTDPLLRSLEHTNACKAAFDSKTLWERYGIIGNVTVSSTPYYYTAIPLTHLFSRSPKISLVRIFTS